jgi:8-oxo-dGTP diphosphatase
MAEESISAAVKKRILSEVRFCVRCGTALERRYLFGEERPICPACQWVFFADPKVAAGVLVEDEDRVLLVRRLNEPGRGLWSFPAGFVDAGEDPACAAGRECLEETGLQVEVLDLLAVIGGREHDRGADIVIVYRARITGGSLSAGDDADLAAFFPRSDLPPLAFRATRRALGIL